MTRTVFDTAQVAHIWAQGRKSEGRNAARRVYFDGPKLFSYGSHFLTGYRLPDGAALLNSGRYSVSTSRHQSDAAHAIRGRGYQIPAALMNGGGRYSSSRFENPLPDFLESRVFKVRGFVRPNGQEVESPYSYEREEGEGYPARFERAPTPADLKAARPGLLKLFLECEETAPAESIAALFRYAGAKPEEAAKAAAKVAAAHAKRAKAEAERAAKIKAEDSARYAKQAATTPLHFFAKQVTTARRQVAAHNWRGAWEREAAGLLESATRLFKARKEAKARGWTRIAADLAPREKLLRAGAKALEAFADKSQARANWGGYREAVQAGRAALQAGAALPPGRSGALAWIEARKGAEALGNAVQNGLKGQGYMKARAALAGADLARMAEGLAALAAAFAEREEAAQAEERAAALAKAAGALAAWREGAGPLPGGRLSDVQGGALLRAVAVKRDDSGAVIGGRLGTSWGAEVPLVEAVKAFRFLKLCRDNGKAWRANGHILEVGHFRVDSVSAEGNFVAGCHRINWGEVAALAARLGLSDLAPADTTQERHKAEA